MQTRFFTFFLVGDGRTQQLEILIIFLESRDGYNIEIGEINEAIIHAQATAATIKVSVAVRRIVVVKRLPLPTL